MGLRDMLAIGLFKINQTRIARQHCENKNKPELACHGKCFLSKFLNTTQLPSEDYPPTTVEKRPVFHVIWYKIHSSYTTVEDYFSHKSFPLKSWLLLIFTSKFFHPPEFQVS